MSKCLQCGVELDNCNSCISCDPFSCEGKPIAPEGKIERKFKYGRFGLTENPIGCYIAMPWMDGRTLLGEVVGTKYDEVRGMLHLNVRHFCGDMWPVSPVASAVTVIE